MLVPNLEDLGILKISDIPSGGNKVCMHRDRHFRVYIDLVESSVFSDFERVLPSAPVF